MLIQDGARLPILSRSKAHVRIADALFVRLPSEAPEQKPKTLCFQVPHCVQSHVKSRHVQAPRTQMK